MKIKPVVFSVLFLCSFLTAAQADRIESKNGNIVEGNIIQETAKGYVMEIPGVGQVSLSKTEVKSVRRDSQAPPAPQAVGSAIDFDDRKWTAGLKSTGEHTRMTQYAPEGESVENWSELVTTEFFPGLIGDAASLEKGVTRTKKTYLERCPSLKFKELGPAGQDILYEWEVSGCKGFDDQTEFARVVLGKEGFRSIHYAVKKTGLPEAEKEKWRNLLKKTALGGEPVERLVGGPAKGV